MTKPPEPVVTGELKVTQADRIAAWPHRADCYGNRDEAGWMRGQYDHTKIIRDFARHRTANALPGDVGMGWIVGSADGTKWRTWTELGPDWADDREKATRYARRVDAEQVHAADEDAWRVEPYSTTLTPSALSGDAVRIDAIIEAAIEVCGKGQASPASVNRLRAALPSHQGAGDE